jgi:hypothetical protein
LAWVDEGVDELALEPFAAAFGCVVGFVVLGFAVVLLVPAPVPELPVDDCPSTVSGEAQTQITARAQPAPIHLRIFARSRFGTKGNPQKRSVASVQ